LSKSAHHVITVHARPRRADRQTNRQTDERTSWQ